MAIRKIREMGDEVLTKVCKEVTKMTPRTTELIDDMLETMYEAMGVGLAAPQVGILKRIVVIDIGEGPPLIVSISIPSFHGEIASNVMCFDAFPLKVAPCTAAPSAATTESSSYPDDSCPSSLLDFSSLRS